MTTLILEARKSHVLVFLIALAFICTLILGGAGGYLYKTLQAAPSGAITTAAPAVDPITGYLYGSLNDRRILVFLEQSGYEGGGTTVNQQGRAAPLGGPGGQIGDVP
jgi:hypothetical protein